MVKVINSIVDNIIIKDHIIDGVVSVIDEEEPSDNKLVTENAVVTFVGNMSGSGGTTDHTQLTNIGTNTHANIDSHISDNNKHLTTTAQTISGAKTFDTSITLGSYTVNGIKNAVNGSSATHLITEQALVNFLSGYV